MANHEERAYFLGLAIIDTFDADHWEQRWLEQFSYAPTEGPEHLKRVAFKLFINSQYRNGMSIREWLPFHQAYRTYRNRVHGASDDQLTPRHVERFV